MQVAEKINTIGSRKRTAIEFICEAICNHGESFELEHDFLRGFRRWAIDVAILDLKIAIEYDGAQFSKGRHQRPMGFGADKFKLNALALLGWLVLTFTTEHCFPPGDYMKDTIANAIRLRRDGITANKWSSYFQYGLGINTKQRNIRPSRRLQE